MVLDISTMYIHTKRVISSDVVTTVVFGRSLAFVENAGEDDINGASTSGFK